MSQRFTGITIQK